MCMSKKMAVDQGSQMFLIPMVSEQCYSFVNMLQFCEHVVLLFLNFLMKKSFWVPLIE